MFHYPDQHCRLHKSFSGHHDLNPPPLSSFPFHGADGLDEILLASHLLPTREGEAAPQDPPPAKLVNAAAPITKSSRSSGNARKRATRKDRHSKIFTAQGPRDRRMRLSLAVAPDFFDLQDMLGFDKASKTVRWLLNMSASAIKDLSSSAAAARPSESSISDCENISAVTTTDYKGKSLQLETTKRPVKARKARKKRAVTKASRKATLHPALARESRTKARERARERTKEKQQQDEASHVATPSLPSVDDEVVQVEDVRCPLSSQQCKKPIDNDGGAHELREDGAGGRLNHIFDYNHNFISNQYVMSLFHPSPW